MDKGNHTKSLSKGTSTANLFGSVQTNCLVWFFLAGVKVVSQTLVPRPNSWTILKRLVSVQFIDGVYLHCESKADHLFKIL